MAVHRRVQPSSALDDVEATLWVELAVEIRREAACPLAGSVDPNATGSVQLVGETCHVSYSATDEAGEDEVRTYTTAVEDDCVCPTFCQKGCVPEVLAIENGSLLVGAYADSRSALGTVLERVKSDAANVRLKRLTTASETADSSGWRHETMDQIPLTEKQREAVRTAVEMGYYESPRDASLGDLADKLGVTRSALSQRLNAVETKLITALASDL
jgi:predicted DNA binding protein